MVIRVVSAVFFAILFTAECSKSGKQGNKSKSKGNQDPVVKVDKKIDIDIREADVYANKTYQTVDFDGSFDEDYNVTGKESSYEMYTDGDLYASFEKDEGNSSLAYEFDLTRQADIEALKGLLNATYFATFGREEQMTYNKTKKAKDLEAAWIEVRQFEKHLDAGKNNKTLSVDSLYQREQVGSKKMGKKEFKYFSEVGVLRDNKFVLDKNFYFDLATHHNRTTSDDIHVNKTYNSLKLTEDIEDSGSVKFGKDGAFQFQGSYDVDVNNAEVKVEDLNILKAFLIGTEAPLLKSLLLELVDERVN